ncbi:MAG: nucleotidyl transferase AbiEii/AbiGii toxin family protein [Prevotellaceae bacterium]|nr:nucleotidyl transferase AbiEii/AbiGii toxin family protein [Prevotellaceae bacterium]
MLKIVPIIADVECFAIHGGTAINLYMLDLPRYSVDIDLTYIPLKPRNEAFAEIRDNLMEIERKIKSVVPNMIIDEKPNKIFCNQRGTMVKVEVSGIKRGLIEPVEIKTLCKKAQTVFETSNKAKIVSLSQLYGGKIIASLDRQHPRDLFDVKLMFDFVTDFSQIKNGFFYCLLGGDRPLVETLQPHLIDQKETLINQFAGMTEIPFSYTDYEETREKIIHFINSSLTVGDKDFLIAFESGSDLTAFVDRQHYLQFPSVQWKLQNIQKLKEINTKKLKDNIKKLEKALR